MTMTKHDQAAATPRHRDLFERFLEGRPFIPRSLLLWPDDGDDVRLEEYKEGSTLVVRAELAGIDPDKDVTICIDRGMLRIEVHREEETETGERDYVRREFRYGSHVREIALPMGVTEHDVRASYKGGILDVRVKLPTDESTVKKVPIKST